MLPSPDDTGIAETKFVVAGKVKGVQSIDNLLCRSNGHLTSDGFKELALLCTAFQSFPTAMYRPERVAAEFLSSSARYLQKESAEKGGVEVGRVVLADIQDERLIWGKTSLLQKRT